LLKALADRGYTQVEVHAQPQHLIGYHGDLRAQQAHVIVRRQYVGGASNDIGFLKGPDGTYRAIISDYDKGRHNALWMEQLTDSYSEHGVIKQAARQGLRFLGKQKNSQGEVQLQFLERG
jgi:hypothetical protein